MSRRKKAKVENLFYGGKSVNCGCCASVIKNEDDHYSIEHGEREIYSLLFTNFKVKEKKN
jgi:hypothetical protein